MGERSSVKIWEAEWFEESIPELETYRSGARNQYAALVVGFAAAVIFAGATAAFSQFVPERFINTFGIIASLAIFAIGSLAILLSFLAWRRCEKAREEADERLSETFEYYGMEPAESFVFPKWGASTQVLCDLSTGTESRWRISHRHENVEAILVA